MHKWQILQSSFLLFLKLIKSIGTADMLGPVATTWTNCTPSITPTTPVHSTTPVFVSIIRVRAGVVTSVFAL